MKGGPGRTRPGQDERRSVQLHPVILYNFKPVMTVAYDSKRGLVILFGGLGNDGFLGDTWSWDGTKWTRLAETGPEPRGMGYLAYDKRRDRVVLFGGRKGYPDGDLNDTWEWDGTRWQRVGN